MSRENADRTPSWPKKIGGPQPGTRAKGEGKEPAAAARFLSLVKLQPPRIGSNRERGMPPRVAVTGGKRGGERRKWLEGHHPKALSIRYRGKNIKPQFKTDR